MARYPEADAGLCAKGCGRPRRSRAYCRECNAAAARSWRDRNRERHNEYARVKASSTLEVHDRLLAAYRAKYPVGIRKRARAFQPHSVKQRREYVLLKNYGLTVESYSARLAAQGGGCAICGATESGDSRRPALHVDHDHASGVVRGILCMGCNRAIGSMGDSPARLRRAATYLEQGL